MKRWYLPIVLSLMAIGITLQTSDTVTSQLESAGKKLLVPVGIQKIFPSDIEDKQAKEVELLKEKKALEESEKQFNERTHREIDWSKARLDAVTDKLRKDPDDEFLNRKLAVVNERLQVIKNEQQSREQKVATIDENIVLLQTFLKDPDLKDYKRSLNLSERDTYSLEDLQNLSQLIIEKERSLAQLYEQEKNADVEIENRKRAATESNKKKRDDQEKIVKPETNDTFGLGVQQRGELAKLEEQLSANKSQRDLLRIEEIEFKKALIKTKIFIEKSQLDVIKHALEKVKPAIKVSEADIALSRDEFAKKQQQSLVQKESYNQEIESIVKDLKSQEKTVQELSARYDIAVAPELEEWAKVPKETPSAYADLFEIGTAYDAMLLLQRRKEMVEAHITLEEEKLHVEAMNIDIKESFYKITTHKFTSEDDTKQEHKKYDILRAEIKANLASKLEQKNSAQDKLNRQKKAFINIKEVRQKLQEKKSSLFKDHEQEYIDNLDFLNVAEEAIQSQIDLLNAMIGVYSDIIALLTSMIKNIDFIAVELELTTVWQRSKYAITWEGIQQIVPNIEAFIRDIHSYFTHLDMKALIQELKDQTNVTHFGLVVALYIFFLCLFAAFAQWVLPYIARFCVHMSNRYRALRFTLLLIALILGYSARYAILITLFSSLFFVFHTYHFVSPYPAIVVYLCAIPCLLYLAHRFMRYFARFNMQHNYIFIAKDFQHRFILVASTLLYATIIIFFFREAFLKGAYRKSELPNILLAVNFIIFQISLIFLIAKEHILSIIPTTGDAWKWFALQVDRFYYLILMLVIAIIVMSNPYVGFGKLVLHVLRSFVFTLILVRLLFWFNSLLKRGLSYVFFSRGTEEFMKERFAYAKTLFGVCAIAILFFFIVVLVIGTAKIWGWPETFANINHWSDIMAWLKTPVLLEKTESPISAFSILKILSFVMIGMLIAFWIDRFVIERIFDALLVEPGVQNTVSSMVRYVIVIMAIIFGFQSVGLGELVIALLGALILGIGWVIKDPLGDFIAYFIILVQRPVKIGDYIRLEEGTEGVVRKITARSVFVRRRNSVTIILPNTTIINKPLVNWNYVRGFVAFEDIRLLIAYKEDPSKVKALLLQVLDENSFVLKSPTPIVRLEDFSEVGYSFLVRGFLSSNYTLDSWEIASDVRLAIVKKLREHGIQIAVPTRVITNKGTFFDGDESLMKVGSPKDS